MKIGKRRKRDDTADEPAPDAAADVPEGDVTETWTAALDDAAPDDEPAASEPPVDSDAVELPAPVPEPAPGPAPLTPPVPSVPEPPAPAAAAPIYPAEPAFATSGFSAADGHAPAAPVMDEIRVLAADRPELVVGAAFAGGILAAMILRRLGN